MMYTPDAVEAVIRLMEADPARLKQRNAFNITAVSVDPEDIAAAIRRHRSDFAIDYRVDPARQAIAENWPDTIDATCAAREWGFSAAYDLERMTGDMLEKLAPNRARPSSAGSAVVRRVFFCAKALPFPNGIVYMDILQTI